MIVKVFDQTSKILNLTFRFDYFAIWKFDFLSFWWRYQNIYVINIFWWRVQNKKRGEKKNLEFWNHDKNFKKILNLKAFVKLWNDKCNTDLNVLFQITKNSRRIEVLTFFEILKKHCKRGLLIMPLVTSNINLGCNIGLFE